MRRALLILGLTALVLFASGAFSSAPEPRQAQEGTAAAHPDESSTSSGHSNPVAAVLLGLVVILLAAKLGGELAERVQQPAVLGELVAGVVIGNLVLVGYRGLEFLGTNQGIAILAQIGVILLLFKVGLETNLHEMLSVGLSSLLVAVLGVIAPVLMGYGVTIWLLPDEEPLVHLFVGATLAATSVGITARVLSDLGKVTTREARIILGAAVIDDVLGLVLLAVCSGLITAANTGGELAAGDIVWIVCKAALFLVGAVIIGGWLSPRLFRLSSRARIHGMLLAVALSFCFLVAYLASVIDLAPIVGAFAAGMILDEVHYRDYLDSADHGLEDLLEPINIMLVPIFFVLMGIRVDLRAFGNTEVLLLATALTVVAIVGKMLCWFGIVKRGLDRLSVAVGMVPRGEVGLIFAGIGATLMLHGERVITVALFSAIVIMVIVTTLVTPPALKITLARGERKKAAREAAAGALSE